MKGKPGNYKQILQTRTKWIIKDTVYWEIMDTERHWETLENWETLELRRHWITENTAKLKETGKWETWNLVDTLYCKTQEIKRHWKVGTLKMVRHWKTLDTVKH